MTRRIVRLTATLGTAALFGPTGAALAGAASAAPVSPSVAASPASADGTHFIDWYPDKTSCQNGGEYYKRHGYSGYICQLSKITVLVPLLAVVDALLLGVLRMLDRLPPADARVYAALFGVILIEATSALALGLLVSAAVRNAAQACLALPMLCFPQVLFAGAVVPVTDMAAPGRAFGEVLANRHAFQALGSLLGLDERFASSPDLSSYVPAFTVSAWRDLLLLAVLGVAAFLAAVWTLHRRTLPTGR